MDETTTQNNDQNLETRYQCLQEILQSHGKVIVAYSGGVDSTFLLRAAVDTLGSENVLGCIGKSGSLAQKELDEALEWAAEMGARVEMVYPREMNNSHYRENPPDRCYYCKSELYELLQQMAEREGYKAVLCGTNVDDLSDFRPGLKAAKQWKVSSPLEEAGLTKNDIRVLSQRLGLASWDKPAQPCLASRMTYGLEITPERLKQIEEGEVFLRRLGLSELRVRHHGHLVRIEAPREKITELVQADKREIIVKFFKKLGFSFISLDLEGLRSGSGNEPLENTVKENYPGKNT
ncbi:MAG: ATP-dependent sacrificial sulfur transferase LarE [Planctomycetes bacterium]|nr:ATP-dependent sacrificial sulfur transferase LarE [Planctomycetota bacterium]